MKFLFNHTKHSIKELTFFSHDIIKMLQCSLSPGRMSTLSLEVSRCPSLYQVSTGGGTALVSQYREMGLLRITSLTSPLLPGPESESPKPRKLGGTETQIGF